MRSLNTFNQLGFEPSPEPNRLSHIKRDSAAVISGPVRFWLRYHQVCSSESEPNHGDVRVVRVRAQCQLRAPSQPGSRLPDGPASGLKVSSAAPTEARFWIQARDPSGSRSKTREAPVQSMGPEPLVKASVPSARAGSGVSFLPDSVSVRI